MFLLTAVCVEQRCVVLQIWPDNAQFPLKIEEKCIERSCEEKMTNLAQYTEQQLAVIITLQAFRSLRNLIAARKDNGKPAGSKF